MTAEFNNKDFTQLVDSLLIDLGANGITDTNVGSVTRTMVEAFSKEMAVCYQQLEKVYEMGYLDTATGSALDKVVVLLGITRLEGDYLHGKVYFSRGTAAEQNITIPVNTLIASSAEDQAITFQTTAQATLQAGELKVEVGVRSTEPAVEGQEAIAQYVLDILPEPIYGIEEVANLTAISPDTYTETDAELKERAKNIIHTAPKGTEASLGETIRRMGYQQFSIKQLPTSPGVVNITIGDDKIDQTQLESIETALKLVKPAGITMELKQASRIFVSMQVSIIVADSMSNDEKKALEDQLKTAITAYVDSLEVEDSLRWSKVYNILLNDEKINKIKQIQTFNEAQVLANSPYMQVWKQRDQENIDDALEYQDVSVQYLDGEDESLLLRLNAGERIYIHPATPFSFDIQPEKQVVKTRITMVDGLNLTSEQINALIGLIQTYINSNLNKTLSFADIQTGISDRLFQETTGFTDVQQLTVIAFTHHSDGRYVELSTANQEQVDWFGEQEILESDQS